ncbi:MAG TPA: amidohydrolase family protein [Methylomirabilota bacterium]|jgi:predicted TIM-barrel fold metal-dependent hydrolase|nr:amidohydrolase family protein [Methylomirabilota bacterium]
MDLSAVPLYDHHAHALFTEAAWRGAPLEPYLSEANDAEQLRRFGRDTLTFRRSIRELAAFHGCAPTAESVLEVRRHADYPALVQRMFAETRIGHWLIDDGLWTDRLMSLADCAALVPGIPVRRILRLEVELAEMIERHDRASDLLAAFGEHLTRLAPGVAAFKSIAAYRSGLDVGRPSAQEIEMAFTAVRRDVVPGRRPRLAAKPLIDAMLWTVLPIAAATHTPVQFHTGFGDPDLDLRLANPLHLRPLFEAQALRGLCIVLLHCYPFVREAGYLASVYPAAYVDLGLTVPYASVHAMRTAFHEALHLAPITKVLLSTDAQRTPETFWLAARWGRRVLGEVLDASVTDGDLSADEASWAATRILFENAATLYAS